MTKDQPPPKPFIDVPFRGGRFIYDRLARQDESGSIPLNQLGDDEVVIWPGYIYRMAS